MFCTPAKELLSRMTCLQQAMQQKGIEGVLIQQSSDLFYYAGVYQTGVMYIPCQGEGIFFVKRNHSRAIELSSLNKILPFKHISQLPACLKKEGLAIPSILGLEMDVIPAQLYQELDHIFLNSQLVDCASLIRAQRMIKSSYELAIMQQASFQTDAFFQELPSIIQPGKKEFEVAAELECAARNRGHQGVVRLRGLNSEFYFGCVLAGENAVVSSFFDGPLGGPGLNPSFPFGPGRGEIKHNEPVMVDYAGVFDGYCIDMSRIYVVGTLPDILLQAHQIALDIQQKLMNLAKPGIYTDDLYTVSYHMARKAGVGRYFMGYHQPVSFVGHGLGIELNEWPVLSLKTRERLQKNMTIALEPKFAFPGLGAVGIENTFVVQSNGLKKLSTLPDEIITISP